MSNCIVEEGSQESKHCKLSTVTCEALYSEIYTAFYSYMFIIHSIIIRNM